MYLRQASRPGARTASGRALACHVKTQHLPWLVSEWSNSGVSKSDLLVVEVSITIYTTQLHIHHRDAPQIQAAFTRLSMVHHILHRFPSRGVICLMIHHPFLSTPRFHAVLPKEDEEVEAVLAVLVRILKCLPCPLWPGRNWVKDVRIVEGTYDVDAWHSCIDSG